MRVEEGGGKGKAGFFIIIFVVLINKKYSVCYKEDAITDILKKKKKTR